MINYHKIRHIIWDFDGTLCNTYPAVAKAFHQALKEFNYLVPQSQLIDLVKKDLRKTYIYFSEKFSIQLYSLQKAFLKNWEKIPILTHQEPFEGTYKILKLIIENGGKNLVVTHRDRRTTNKILKGNNIQYYIYDMICSDDNYPRKPNPNSIIDIIIRNNLDKNNILTIGDRNSDIKAGKEAGIYTCFFGHHKPEISPDINVSNYHELYTKLTKK